MITMRNWVVEVPECDRWIGMDGEQFTRLLAIRSDAPEGWAYRLDVKYGSGRQDFLLLERAEDGTLWTELRRDAPECGIVKAQVRGVWDGREQKSNVFELEVLPSLHAAREFDRGCPTAFRQLEARLEAIKRSVEATCWQSGDAAGNAAESAEKAGKAAAEAGSAAADAERAAGEAGVQARAADASRIAAEVARQEAEEQAGKAGEAAAQAGIDRRDAAESQAAAEAAKSAAEDARTRARIRIPGFPRGARRERSARKARPARRVRPGRRVRRATRATR